MLERAVDDGCFSANSGPNAPEWCNIAITLKIPRRFYARSNRYGAAVETVTAAMKLRWTLVAPKSSMVILSRVCPSNEAGSS
jgi:hypothetical protein